MGFELSDSRWFVYTCYECTVFAPIVIKFRKRLPVEICTRIAMSKNKHWVSLNDMNTGMLKKKI